jgi:hypothetical protein
MRSMSMALAMIVIHLLGDVMSPVLAGALWQVNPLTVHCALRIVLTQYDVSFTRQHHDSSSA